MDDEGLGSCTGMKIPFVASAACWRKTVELEPLVDDDKGEVDEEAFGVGDGSGSGNWRMSIGIASR